MRKIISGILIVLFGVTVGYCQESKQSPELSNKLKELKEDIYPSKEQEAKLTWKNLISYLRTEAKFWDTSNYIGKEVLFDGQTVALDGNLLHIRNEGGSQGPMVFDCFVEPSDNINRYRKSDSMSVEVFGLIMSINESHQIFVKAKRIVIKASQ